MRSLHRLRLLKQQSVDGIREPPKTLNLVIVHFNGERVHDFYQILKKVCSTKKFNLRCY